MEGSRLNWIANFIWSLADDVLRDLYVRGKHRDVILPMTVLRRLDSLLEPSQPAVLEMKTSLDKAKIIHQDSALRQAAGQSFYNTSKFTLRDLKARASQQQLKADFEAYLDGFSPNVQDILEKFEFRNQIPRLSKADALGTLIEKFLSPDVNLSPHPVLHGDGSIKHPGLDNHAMGTIFEELVRRFNEENNEEAGEHWTPRDAVTLMAKLVFLPVTDQIDSGTYLVYDGACGTGGMLTVAEETLTQLAWQRGKQVATHLYGQEINSETYAIAKADLLLKGEGEAADNIVGSPSAPTFERSVTTSARSSFHVPSATRGAGHVTQGSTSSAFFSSRSSRRSTTPLSGFPAFSRVAQKRSCWESSYPPHRPARWPMRPPRVRRGRSCSGHRLRRAGRWTCPSPCCEIHSSVEDLRNSLRPWPRSSGRTTPDRKP